MRATIALASAAAAVAVAVAVANPVRAAEVVEKASFKGKNAFVAFNGSAPITCPDASSGTLETTVFLSGFEFVMKSRLFPDDQANTVFAQLIQFNSCTEEFLSAQGAVQGAFTANGLRSAHMTATIPLTDIAGPVGTLAVDIELTATGPTVRTRTRSRTKVEGPEGDLVVTFLRFAGKTRTAVASGTLVFNGVTLVGTLHDAFLDDSKTGEMIVVH
jgi:hypothetical protein